MQKLTPSQLKILECIKEYIGANGYPPSVRDICAAAGLASPSTAQFHLNALEREGYIVRDGGRNRSIRLTEPTPSGVPIIGTVAAGSPILAVEDALGYIPYEPSGSGEFFALKIKGDSMVNAGILDGDMVVVRRQAAADEGEIVIAMIEGEATCKRLSRENGRVWLLPENPAYSPIDGSNAVLLGRVSAVIRKY